MKKTVLVVDDSPSMRKVVCMTLLAEGFELIEASNGLEAVALLDGRRIDLVISDVNMPELDGLEFVRRLKAHSAYRFVPVIMLTTIDRDDKKAEGKAAGVRAWVVKPFQPSALLDVIHRLAV